jgi:hypothetical protein
MRDVCMVARRIHRYNRHILRVLWAHHFYMPFAMRVHARCGMSLEDVISMCYVWMDETHSDGETEGMVDWAFVFVSMSGLGQLTFALVI